MTRPSSRFRRFCLALLCSTLSPAAGAAPERGAYQTVNGIAMYYEAFGAGPPLLLLHGGTGTVARSFARQVPFFAGTHRIIAPEQVGHGHTADAEHPYSYAQMADDTAALLGRLGVARADVLGVSDGGEVALYLAARHPALVRRLIVVGAGFAHDDAEKNTRWTDTITPETWPADDAYARASPDGVQHWPVVLGKLRGMWKAWPGLRPDEIAAIRAPTLIVVGDRDVVSVEQALRMQKALPGARLFVLPGTGHDVVKARAAWLNPVVASFLGEPVAGDDQAAVHAPGCVARGFRLGEVVADLSRPGQQDVLLGASRGGESVLHQRRARCGAEPFRLLLSDRGPSGTTTQDLTDHPHLRDLRSTQPFTATSFISLSPDGASIVGVSADGRRLLQTTRSGPGAADFGAAVPGPFALVNAALARDSNEAVLAEPLLSGDGLGLYYRVMNDHRLDGHYEASRAAAGRAFRPGKRLAPVAQDFAAVKGVSADRLTLLLLSTASSPWSTTVLTRRTASADFANPNAPDVPPAIPGFRSLLVGGCAAIISNHTPAGCLGEDIHLSPAR